MERIYAVVAEFLRDVNGAAGQVSVTATFEELGIDSISTIDLLNKVEKEFGVVVPDALLPTIITIQDLANFIVSARKEIDK